MSTKQIEKTDNFFSPVENIKPFFKVALEGFAGSGKSFTGALLAAGLHKKIKSKNPVVVFDTEMSTKFLKPIFDKEKIPIVIKESRSLADLKETMSRCRDGFSDILLIDSISHVWEDFLSAYQKKVNRTQLMFSDWGIIKPAWRREFSDPLVRDPFHIIFTGRAGYEYGNEKNPETGRREIFRSGIKMKVEGETSFEPDVLVLMERFEEILTNEKKIWREATIIKDRSNLIDGKTFKNPSFQDFEPAVDLILKDPVVRLQVERDAAELIRTEEEKREFTKKRDILLEKIEAEFTSRWPGSAAAEKKIKVDGLSQCFGTTAWTEIKGMSLKQLDAGLALIPDYAAHIIAEKKAEIKK